MNEKDEEIKRLKQLIEEMKGNKTTQHDYDTREYKIANDKAINKYFKQIKHVKAPTKKESKVKDDSFFDSFCDL